MTEQEANIVLEHLRAIRADVAELKDRIEHIERRLEQLAGLTVAVYAKRDAIDDLQRRVERIERREDAPC